MSLLGDAAQQVVCDSDVECARAAGQVTAKAKAKANDNDNDNDKSRSSASRRMTTKRQRQVQRQKASADVKAVASGRRGGFTRAMMQV